MRKLKLDPTHPLSKDLIIAFPMEEGSSYPINHGKYGAYVTMSEKGNDNWHWGGDWYGRYIEFTAVCGLQSDRSITIPNTEIGSYLTAFMPTSYATSTIDIFGTGNDFECVFKTTDVNDSDMWVSGSNISINPVSTESGTKTDRIFLFGGTVSPLRPGSDIRVFAAEYGDRRIPPQLVGGYGGTQIAPTVNRFRIGCANILESVNSLVGRIYYIFIWTRTLDDHEMLSVMNNPYQMFIDSSQPIIGAHQLPTHVDYGIVKMPWTQCPPGHVCSDKVDFFLNPRSYGTTGRAWNQGRDETADQSDTAVSGYSVVSTQFGGPALALTGVSAQRTEFPANVFVPQDDPKWNDLLTVGAWVRCTDVSDDQQIVGQWKALTQDRSWRLELDTTGSALNFRVQTVDDTGDVITLDIIDTQDLSDGEWHFVAAVFDNTSGTTQCEAFVDGVSVAAASGGAAAGWNNPTAPGPVTIGVRDDADDEPFNGNIFGLFIVREKWTPTEISSIYHNPWQIFKPKEIMVPINEDLPELGRFEIQS